jgi:hypothetical protein
VGNAQLLHQQQQVPYSFMSCVCMMVPQHDGVTRSGDAAQCETASSVYSIVTQSHPPGHHGVLGVTPVTIDGVQVAVAHAWKAAGRDEGSGGAAGAAAAVQVSGLLLVVCVAHDDVQATAKTQWVPYTGSWHDMMCTGASQQVSEQ